METLPRDKNFSSPYVKKYFYFNFHIIICSIWVIIQCALVAYYYTSLKSNSNISNIVTNLYNGFLFAKVSALLINFNFMLLFVILNKYIISLVTNLSYLLPVNCIVGYHIVINMSILLFSIIHVASHVYNFYIIDGNTWTFNSLKKSTAGITGIILVCLYFVVYTFSLRIVRKRFYELFALSHLLHFGIVITLLLHGSFCFFKTDDGRCLSPTFWIYIIIPFTLFIIEKVFREYTSNKKTVFLNIKKYNDNCSRIEIYKPFFEFKAGQWVLVNCPNISRFQWHPFTIVSNPIENGKIELLVKETGTWTKKFTELLYENNFHRDQIKIKVSNPYGYRYDIITKYRAAVLIAGGIGITPFISLLKSLPCNLGHGNHNVYLKKVYLFWVCRNIGDFNCFLTELKEIKNEIDKYGNNKLLSVNLYITGNSETRNGTVRMSKFPLLQFKEGRPDFDTIFHDLVTWHPNNDIKLLFCGSKKMNNDITHKIHKIHNVTNNTKFIFQQGETFT